MLRLECGEFVARRLQVGYKPKRIGTVWADSASKRRHPRNPRRIAGPVFIKTHVTFLQQRLGYLTDLTQVYCNRHAASSLHLRHPTS